MKKATLLFIAIAETIFGFGLAIFGLILSFTNLPLGTALTALGLIMSRSVLDYVIHTSSNIILRDYLKNVHGLATKEERKVWLSEKFKERLTEKDDQ